MFGPLNGVRVALVAGSAVAAILAAVLGYWFVTLVLAIGIGFHGLLWWKMWADQREAADPGTEHSPT
jgi:hypothetical protein